MVHVGKDSAHSRCSVIVVMMFVKGSKQKWVPIEFELPKSSRARRSWQTRRDQMADSAGEADQGSLVAKDDMAPSRRREDRPVGPRKNDGSPRKDRRYDRDAVDKSHGRPNSASAKASSAAGKKGKFKTFGC